MDRHLQLVVGVVEPSTVMRGEVVYRLSQTVGGSPLELVPSGRSLLYIWLSRAAMAATTRGGPSRVLDERTTAMVALVGEDERAVLSQKLLTRASFSPPIRPRSSA